MKPAVVYHDNHCLAVIKPWNMLTQGDRTGDPTLTEWVKDWIRAETGKTGNVYLGLLHRLDRPAGGLVLLARTSRAAARLSAQFREGTVEKTYRIVVAGSPPSRGEWRHYLKKNKADNRVYRVAKGRGGQTANLRYMVLERSEGFSLLSVTLLTGRSHQIRVQFSSEGFAVVGDVKYGADRPLRGRNIALFSHRLAFDHPARTDRLVLEALPPQDSFPWNRFREPPA